MVRHCMRPRPLIFMGMVLWIAGTPPAVSQEPPSEDRIARLVRELGDDVYRIRQEASRSLGSLGELSRRPLERAAGSEDAEVALRAERLLRQLAIEDLWAGNTVTLPDHPVSFVSAIESISRQSGNGFLLQDGLSTYRNIPIECDGKSGAFWPILDEICRQSGNSIRPHFNAKHQGLSILHHRLGENPVAYAGAMRAELTTAHRSFVEHIDYREQASDVEHTFQIQVDTLWENHLRLIAYQNQPEVVEAVLPSGSSLRPIESSPGNWNLLHSNLRQLTATLCFEPPPVAEDRLTKLVLRWPMLAVGDMAELVLSHPKPGDVYYQDDLSLTIESMQSESGGAYRVILRIARDLVPPEPADILLVENSVELLDHNGHPFSTESSRGSFVAETARKTILFRPPNQEAKPAMLRLVYPRIRDIRAVEFEFRDIPLPTGGPQ
ncbi:MAG: hypothetical protein JW829_01720 [Pirellulales bacterium]|nr:hypothetical protein [Pirellulales bacterium]